MSFRRYSPLNSQRNTEVEFDRFALQFNKELAALSPIAGGPVTSFNGRNGTVSPVVGDYSSFYAAIGTTISAGTGLTGGGTLAANRSLALTGNALAMHSLASAAGFLKNDGAGVFSYTQPDAGNLTGATLAAGVTASSLTSVGTLTSLDISGALGVGCSSPNGPLLVQGPSLATSNAGPAGANKGHLRLCVGTGATTDESLTFGVLSGGTSWIQALKPGTAYRPLLLQPNGAGVAINLGAVSPSARLHIAAGTVTASTAPLKFISGTSMTTAEVGAVEFTTDNLFFTITTGAARKAFVLDDGARLTSGAYPKATTNGRLIDGPTPLSGTKIYYVSDSSGGAVDRKLTFTDGILTAET